VNPRLGQLVLLLGLVAMVVIRAPHARKSRAGKVVDDRQGRLEKALLVLMGLGFLVLPLLAMATPLLAGADHSLEPLAFGGGVAAMASSQWLFYRSHRDLGRNWSVTLQVRDGHQLVDGGVYARIRHPMYTSIFLYAIAQTLLLANWIAGPSCLCAFTLMFALRLGPEERMMLDRFGESYAAYRRRTRRLIPFVW